MSSRQPAGGRLAAALGILVLGLLVVLSSRPAAYNVDVFADGAATTLLDSILYLLIALPPLGGIALVWLLWPRPEDAPLHLERRRRHTWLLAPLAGPAVVLLLWWRPAGLAGLPALAPVGQLLSGPLPPAAGARPGSASGIDWTALGIVALLIGSGGLWCWRRLSGRTAARATWTAPEAGLVEDLDRALETELADRGDPRQAVINAWKRVELTLGAHGLRRHPSEAPLHYAQRAGRAAGLEPGALERLAGLYEWARFSQHEVTQAMRVDAWAGLRSIREGLHAVA